MLISGIAMDVPAMGEEGWFDASSKQSVLIGFGIFLMLAGYATGGMFSFALKKSTPESMAKTVAMQKQKQEIFNNELKKYNIDPDEVKNNYFSHKKSQVTTCAYCGSDLEPDAKFCTSCGAKVKKSN